MTDLIESWQKSEEKDVRNLVLDVLAGLVGKIEEEEKGLKQQTFLLDFLSKVLNWK